MQTAGSKEMCQEKDMASFSTSSPSLFHPQFVYTGVVRRARKQESAYMTLL